MATASTAYEAARTTAAVFDRSACAKVELAGPDAATFLHNLCTNDVKNLPVGGGCEAFLTNHKAKVIAHVAVSRRGPESIWLDSAPGQAEKIVSHLNRFLISEQVEIADRTKDDGLVRVVGPSAGSIVGLVLQTSLPALAPWQQVVVPSKGHEVLVRYQEMLGLPAYDCFCDAGIVADFLVRLDGAGAVLGAEEAHETLRVEAGFPVIGKDMDENRFVVEVGRTQAISYAKGCYLGQEPIVMARDRGQVNRTLLGVRAGSGPVLEAGTKLFQGDAEVGQVTSSVHSPRLGEVIALAYLRRGSQEAETELLVADGRKGIVTPLPFAV